MAVEISWLEPQKIIYQTFSGQVTGSEQCIALDTCLQYLDRADAPVHMIADWRNAEVFPYLAETLPRAVRLRRHQSLGWLVVVPTNYVLLYREEILAKIVPFHYRFSQSFEDAVQFLRSLEAERMVA